MKNYLPNTTTAEGYEVIRLSPYDVITSIYKKTKFNSDIREEGYAGTVRNPNLDDRFICDVFCIWNEAGKLIYCDNIRWGEYEHYKLDLSFIKT